MQAVVLQPQTVTRILDSAFRLYRANFLLFLGIVSILYVPYVLVSSALSRATAIDPQLLEQMQAEEIDPQTLEQFGGIPIGPMLAVGVLTLIQLALLQPLATGAVSRAISERYLDRPATIGSAYGFILSHFWRYLAAIGLSGLVIMMPLLVATLAMAVGIALGAWVLILLLPVAIVLAVVFAFWFRFVSPVIVVEPCTAIESLGRSRELARGQFSRIVGLGMLLGLIGLIVTYAGAAALGLATGLLDLDFRTAAMVDSAAMGVVGILVAPLSCAAWVLLYYDVRIRKEGFDLEILARNLAGEHAVRTGPAPFVPPQPPHIPPPRPPHVPPPPVR